MRFLRLVILGSLLCAACSSTPPTSSPSSIPPTATVPATQNAPKPNPLKKCGDGVCTKPENEATCPADCFTAEPTRIAEVDGVPSSLLPGERSNSYWLTNPASGARLYVEMLVPENWDGSPSPTLVLVPGGAGFGTELAASGQAQRLSNEGFVVIVFDPDGRGQSQGEENLNGYIHQDGLAALLRALPALPQVDAGQIGLVSYSYGVTMATGALARHPDVPVRLYIDWEGPVNRYYTTINCGNSGHIDWQPCADDAFWSEREALTFISQVKVPYQRVQSQSDHVQPNNNHAIEIVNAAVAGDVPWVRLNNYPPNQTYSLDSPPAMLEETSDKRLEKTIAEYAKEMLALP